MSYPRFPIERPLFTISQPLFTISQPLFTMCSAVHFSLCHIWVLTCVFLFSYLDFTIDSAYSRSIYMFSPRLLWLSNMTCNINSEVWTLTCVFRWWVTGLRCCHRQTHKLRWRSWDEARWERQHWQSLSSLCNTHSWLAKENRLVNEFHIRLVLEHCYTKNLESQLPIGDDGSNAAEYDLMWKKEALTDAIPVLSADGSRSSMRQHTLWMYDTMKRQQGSRIIIIVIRTDIRMLTADRMQLILTTL